MGKDYTERERVQVTAWQLVATTIGVVASILYVQWTIFQQSVQSDERIVNNLQNNYLTIREHAEFVSNLRSDLIRMNNEALMQNRRIEERIETRASQHEAKLALDSLNARLSAMQAQIDRLTNR